MCDSISCFVPRRRLKVTQMPDFKSAPSDTPWLSELVPIVPENANVENEGWLS